MAQVAFLDTMLREYLVFRGFSGTLKALDSEQKNERDQSFRSEKIVEQFNLHVQSYDLTQLRALWQHLDNTLFSKLEHHYASAVKKLENGLLKYYLVNAYTNNRNDKITEFFNVLSTDYLQQQQSEWKDWFYFPFCKNAEESPIFSLYFTKQWQDTLQISIRNFLTTIYQCLPQPTFIHAADEAAHIRRLQEENAILKTRLLQAHQLQQQMSMSISGSSQNLSASGDTRRRSAYRLQQNLSDILPFDISPPGHVVDDFCIIASEVNNVTQTSDAQARGLKMLIRNIGSSPVGKKENVEKSNKRRSGSVGRNWI